MVFFLYESYDRDEVEQAILKLGYEKTEFEVFGHIAYQYIKDDIIINLTSPSEGRIQIQGEGVTDLYRNKEQSPHYQTLEDLARAIKPKRVVDSNVQDMFPELANL